MIAALRRLAANHELVETRHQELAAFKINGLPGWTGLFSTHPPLQVRIAALERTTN
jgi:Zn-dependent protease with chaperone function